MIELPEAYTYAKHFCETLAGKNIVNTVADSHHHGFAWYTGDPKLYGLLLNGKAITGSAAYGGRPEIWAEDMRISFNDGVRIRYLNTGEKRPDKHQLLLDFDDGTALVCTVQMYGGMEAFKDGDNNSSYYLVGKEKPSPYDDAFNENYFDGLRQGVKASLSVKAFLATEQRIPGFGNGVLQDVLFNARIHPKTKLNTLSDTQFLALFHSVKNTLKIMRDGGGRNTEKDLFGNAGGYHTILSSKTLAYPCHVCGDGLKREAYLGGNIYFCPTCQPFVK
jgi:formamidopyrimidine-DNA glycosylase